MEVAQLLLSFLTAFPKEQPRFSLQATSQRLLMPLPFLCARGIFRYMSITCNSYACVCVYETSYLHSYMFSNMRLNLFQVVTVHQAEYLKLTKSLNATEGKVVHDRSYSQKVRIILLTIPASLTLVCCYYLFICFTINCFSQIENRDFYFSRCQGLELHRKIIFYKLLLDVLDFKN